MPILFVGNLWAQTEPSGNPGPWQMSAFGGWYSGGQLYTFRNTHSSNVRLEDAASYGLRLEYEPLRWLGLEVEWSQSQPDVAFVNDSRGIIGAVPLNTYLFLSHFSVGTNRLRGFVSIGFGGAYISPYVPGALSGDTNFTASVGLGGKAFLSRHVGLRLDVRVLETYANISPHEPVYCQPDGCFYYKRNWFLTYQATAGAVYAF
jgi:hypothetical protein